MAVNASDILIVGAGLAGAAAAEALAARGLSVTVLEARDRVGGRGYARAFAGSDEWLEFGGAWIERVHPRFKTEATGENPGEGCQSESVEPGFGRQLPRGLPKEVV